MVAEDHLSVEARAERGSYVGCIAGALSRREYLDGLTSAGFSNATVRFTPRPRMACIAPSSRPPSRRLSRIDSEGDHVDVLVVRAGEAGLAPRWASARRTDLHDRLRRRRPAVAPWPSPPTA